MIQENKGFGKKKWTGSGMIIEDLGRNTYLVKVDPSGRLLKRKRHTLRRLTNFEPDLAETYVVDGETSPRRSERIKRKGEVQKELGGGSG